MRTIVTSCVALLSLGALAAACGKDDKASSDNSGDTAAKAACVPVTDADFVGTADANSCTQQMFTTYGGTDTFAKVTQAIITESLKQENVAILGESFQTRLAGATKERQAAFTQHLQTFIESVYSGNSVPYPTDFPTMQASHASLQITFAQYDAFLEKIIVPVLQSFGVAASDISNCFAPPLLAPATKKTVITCK